MEHELLYSPRQLPELEGEALTLTWDQIEADSIISHGDQIVWQERTGWEVYDRFEEITEIFRQSMVGAWLILFQQKEASTHFTATARARRFT